MASEIVAYYRVSTKEQGLDGHGIEAQRQAVRSYAQRAGFPILAEYAEVETGRKDDLRNRPQLVRAVGHARRSRALLVIARIDRLARSVFVTSQLLASGVDFVACDNPHANRLTVHILAAMAEHEGRLISERTKAGLAAARSRGVVFPPGRGFTLEERRRGQVASRDARLRKTREVYADLVPIVGELLKDPDVTLRSIGDVLTEMGHCTQRGGEWSPSVVRALIARQGWPPVPRVLSRSSAAASEMRAKGVIASRSAALLRVRQLAAEVGREALAIAATGASWAEVARHLNRQGLRNAVGTAWTHQTLLRLLRTAELTSPRSTRQYSLMSPEIRLRRRQAASERVELYLPIVERLRAIGQTSHQIARVLNEAGFKPARCDRWNSSRVSQLLVRVRRFRKNAVAHTS